MTDTDIRFMTDSSAKDGRAEIIFDYEVSWLMRRAQNKCANDKGREVLYRYARRFLSLLLGIELQDNDEVIVKTEKQWQDIDVKAVVIVNGVSHMLSIEDKFYSGLQDDQLRKYRESFDKDLDANHPDSIRHYLLLTCGYDTNATSKYDKLAQENGYRLIWWDQILYAMFEGENTPQSSGSDLFDEFFIHW